MRKTTLLVAILIVVGLVLVIVLRSLTGSEHVDSVAPSAVAPEPERPSAKLERDTELNRPTAGATENARTAATEREPDRVGSRLECALRIHVVLPAGVPAAPRGLEVQVATDLGAVHDAHLEGDVDFVVRDLHPGTFVVVVKAPGWKRLWKRVLVEARPVEVASHDAPQHETRTEIVLERVHRIRVRWRTPDGRPILEGLGSPTSSSGPAGTYEELEARTRPDGKPLSSAPEVSRTSLSVHATQGVPPLLGLPSPGQSLASWTLYAIVSRDENGRQTASASPWLASRGTPLDPNPPPDAFAMLEVDVDGPVFVGVWRDQVRLDMAQVAADQDEVVFTTSAQALDVPRVPVSVRVVDDVTGLPLPEAWIQAGSDSTRHTVDESGSRTFAVAPGPCAFVVGAGDHDDEHVTRTLEPDTTVDLGLVRLRRAGDRGDASPRDYVVTFRVRDESGRTVDTMIELVRLSSYDGTGVPGVIDAQFTGRLELPSGARASEESKSRPSGGRARQDAPWPREPGVVTFRVREPDRYVLRGVDPNVDIEPILVPAAAFTREPVASSATADPNTEEPRITADVVVRAPRVVCFRFDEPPMRGTRIAIETVDGLPVRVLDTNDFGVVQTWLGARDHRLHLIENGEATSSLRFTVDRDPFVLEIHR